MGSSFIDYRGKGFWSRDGFIEDFLQCLADATSSLPPDHWIREAADHWRLQASGAFNGWVHPKFDEYISSEGRREVVLQLLNAVRSRPDATQHLQETCDLVERLIKGELSTDASSPLDYMVGRIPGTNGGGRT